MSSTPRLAMRATTLDISDAEARAGAERLVQRLSDEDASLWSDDAGQRAEIGNLLGWIRIAERLEPEAGAISKWAAEASDGIDDVVLLGMGGSSLAPEVMAAMLPAVAGRPRLTVLDSTDPATVRRVSGAIDLTRTLFVVASKSGGTLETATLYATFRAQYEERGIRDAGSHFIAITDPGTSMAQRAADDGFARTFLNDPRIGGRYSALSYFGLVPAALVGLDIAAVLRGAVEFGQAALDETDIARNSAVRLGLALGALAQRGRDKLTLALSPTTHPIGAWIEQLVAESTGKHGLGIVPVDGEALGDPSVYGDDRVFVGISVGDEALDGLDALAEAGHPVIRLTLSDVHDLGAEFWRWELATAVAGWVLGINPFDQPNVEESKANTARVLAGVTDGASPLSDQATSAAGEALRAAGASGMTAAEAVATFLSDTAPGDYVSIHAYLDRTPAHEARLRDIQTSIRDRTNLATTLGFGPRFLHSTGQLHKGGPNRGVFMQITCDHGEDVPIPGEAYGFATLIDAQAEGDLRSLRDKERRVLRLAASEPAAALDELAAVVERLS
ncbi:MAG: glucose-6-phosphate isomerase [Chloroflexi bacterium]|nr:glucose-6-phosphate isomerase [Chloroflexota bacterium]